MATQRHVEFIQDENQILEKKKMGREYPQPIQFAVDELFFVSVYLFLVF